MTVPSQPSPTIIVTDALTRFLNSGTPSNTEISRGIEYGIEKVKRDIMGIGKTWRPLLKTSYDITVAGVSQYQNPSDFEVNFTVGLMTGSHSGTLSNVTSASVVYLGASEDVTQSQAEGKLLLITSGTGVDQARIIDNYSPSIKRAELATAFSTTPATADGYIVVDSVIPLRDLKSIYLYDRYQYHGINGTPRGYVNIPDDTLGVLALHPTPDSVMGLQRRYYADLLRLNTESDLYDKILRDWAGVFVQGVYVWKLGEDDDRYQAESALYQGMLLALAMHDLVGFTKEAATAAAAGGA